MNKVDSISHSNHYLDTLKKTGQFVGGTLAALVFIVAHPIIGPLGSLGLLFKAAYHGILLNYHWRHTREIDEKGNLIPETELNHPKIAQEKNYMKKDAKFQSEDLIRLQHEVQRQYHLNKATESLKWARGLAKCTIPIVGLFWALISELNAGGSMEIGCPCTDAWHHKSPEEMLEWHIEKLN